MRINDIINENQDLNELSMGGIGRGIEKVAGGLAKGAGYVAGIPGGLKKSFQKGKARAHAGLGGEMPPAATKPVDPDYAKEYARLTGQAAPTAGAAQPVANVQDLEKQIKQKWSELEQLRKQYAQMTQGGAGGTTGQPAAGAGKEAEPAEIGKLAGTQQSSAGADNKQPETPAATAEKPADAEVPNPELERMKKLAGQTPSDTPTVDTSKMASAPAEPTVPDALTAKQPEEKPADVVKKQPEVPASGKPGATIQPSPVTGYSNVSSNVPGAVPQVSKVPGAQAPKATATQSKGTPTGQQDVLSLLKEILAKMN